MVCVQLLKSLTTLRPMQTDTFGSNSKVSVDPMRVLDSLMPSTTIENLSRLWPLFFPPVHGLYNNPEMFAFHRHIAQCLHPLI